MNPRDNLSYLRMFISIAFFLFIAYSIGYIIFSNTSNINEQNKLGITEGLLEGSLGVASLSLSVLTYLITRHNELDKPNLKKPYKMISHLTYFIILTSLSEASTSLLYLLFKDSFFFNLAIFLIYVLVLSIFISLGVWVEKEFAW